MRPKNLLRDHLDDIDESYFEHFSFALGFGVRMLGAGLACLVHALLPFTFVRTGSKCISTLHDEMVISRRNLSKRRANRPTA